MRPVIIILLPLLLAPLAVLQAADAFKPAAKPNSTFISAAKHDMKTRVGALDAPGGLIVHVGSRNLDETVALRKDGAFLIHVLYADPAESDKARSWIAEQGLSGKVTVSTFDGGVLPFIDNVANMLIVEDGFHLSMTEMERVVAPRGKTFWRQNGEWQQEVKKVSPTIDDWTHNLYDAGNTGVSHDMVAGSPRHLQWSGNPRFSRSHDGNTSFVAMVSCGGRIFYLMDEGSTAFLSLPPRWMLTARDGFNGKVLWKKPLDEAMIAPIGNIKNSFANLGHRMVAQNDVLYATLGFDAPVSALDSRTGEQIWKSPETDHAEELLLYDGILYCVINLSATSRFKDPFLSMEPAKQALASSVSRKLVAVDATTGALLWQKSPPEILPLSLTVGKAGVFIHDGMSIVCLQPTSGKEVWCSEPLGWYKNLLLYSGVNVVLKDDVLLFACGTAYGRQFYNEGRQPFMHLFAMDKTPKSISYAERFKGAKKKDRRGGPHIQSGTATVPVSKWSKTIDIYVRALLVARNMDGGKPDLLFAIGFPEVIDEYDAIELINEHQRKDSSLARLYQKEKSAGGELGAKLLVVSAADGNVISETKLACPSVFDGMSGADRKIFFADIRGNVTCLKPQ